MQLTALSRRVVIDIQDDGPGIPDAARAHLFEPGWRVQPHDGHTVDTGAGAKFTITVHWA